MWIGCVVVLITLITILLKFTLFSGYHGLYFEPTKTFWCDSKWACLHEIGHMADDKSGWISKSDDFTNVLIEFSKTDHPWAKIVLQQRGRNVKEIYAELLEASRSCAAVPDMLKRFYDCSFINSEFAKIKF
jgi:hypothetical protein